MHRINLAACLLLTLLSSLAAAPMSWAADPQITFGPDRVIAEGLSPGTEAIFFGMVVQRNGSVRQYRRVDRVVADDDRDGLVELVWDGDLPPRSIWAVIDARNGKHAIEVPEHMTRREIPLSVDDLVRDQGDLVGVLQQQRSYIEVLLFHPGSGAWGVTTGDGTSTDADGEHNGSITVQLSAMQPLYDSGAAPRVLVNGGILMIIDPRRMEFGVTRVTGGGQTTAAQQAEGVEVGS